MRIIGTYVVTEYDRLVPVTPCNILRSLSYMRKLFIFYYFRIVEQLGKLFSILKKPTFEASTIVNIILKNFQKLEISFYFYFYFLSHFFF